MKGKISNPWGKKGKNEGMSWVNIELPAHLNEALIKFQDSEEMRDYQRPAKSAVILRALTEFLATRIAPAMVLILCTSCQRGHIDIGIKLLFLMGIGVLIGHIAYIVKNSKKL